MIASEAWVGQDIAKSRYRIEGRISQTNMACTYLAFDQRLQTKVVVKTPQPELVQRDPNLSERFNNQVQIMVRLACPHIVSILDFGTHGDLPFVVLQHLEGGSLDDWIRTMPNRGRQPQSVGRLKNWLLDTASTLDFIHQNKYVHRDVQPANILFDGQQHVFLADFGVVKALSENGPGGRMLTVVGQQIIGTPSYMAPELISGGNVDGGIDQWSLAVTVYEFLGGRLPFSGDTPAQVLQHQTQKKPLPLPQLRRDLPNQLWPAVQRALSVKPEGRFPTCTQFAQAILQTIEETPLPVSSPRPTIEKTILQSPPPFGPQSQPHPQPRPAQQQYVTANVPGPAAGRRGGPQSQPTQTEQAAARRHRTEVHRGGIGWATCIGIAAAAVIVTATLMCVIGKTQWPGFLAAMITPSTEATDEQLAEAKETERRYKSKLRAERERADAAELAKRDAEQRANALMADKNRLARIQRDALMYKAVVRISNPTTFNIAYNLKYRMWDGTWTGWERYTDKDRVHTRLGAVRAEIEYDSDATNGVSSRKKFLRCEVVFHTAFVTSSQVRNHFYFNGYKSGGKQYIQILHK